MVVYTDHMTTRQRPIDIHELSICAVLDSMFYAETAYEIALIEVAERDGLTTERLDQLVRTWCAIAGIPAPTTV